MTLRTSRFRATADWRGMTCLWEKDMLLSAGHNTATIRKNMCSKQSMSASFMILQSSREATHASEQGTSGIQSSGLFSATQPGMQQHALDTRLLRQGLVTTRHITQVSHFSAEPQC